MLDNIISQLNLNISITYHFLLFGVSWGLLSLYFFKPMMEYLKKRDQKTTLLSDQIREMKLKLEDLKSAYSEAKVQIHLESHEILSKHHKQGNDLYQELVTKARVSAIEQLNKKRQELQKEKVRVSGELILQLNEVKKLIQTVMN